MHVLECIKRVIIREVSTGFITENTPEYLN